MTYYTMKRCFGGSDLGPYGFWQGTRTQDFSIKEQAKEEGRITLMTCMTEKGHGKLVWMVCPGLLSNTIRNYLHLQTQITWIRC